MLKRKPLRRRYTSVSFCLPELRLASLRCSSAFQGDRQRIPMRYPEVRPKPSTDQNRFLVALTILPIDTNGYIPSQSDGEAGGEFYNHGSPAGPQRSRVDHA